MAAMKSKNGTDHDTAIVFAENETEVTSVMENYIRNFNENYGIWIGNTDFIPLDNNCELEAIHSVKEFTGSVLPDSLQMMMKLEAIIKHLKG